MLRVLFSLFFFSLHFYLYGAGALDVRISSPHACLVNLETGKVLYEKRARESIYPASTTKIATFLYACHMKDLNLDEIITCRAEDLIRTTEGAKLEKNYQIPAHYLEIDGVLLNLRPNEKIRMKTLLYGVLLRSANDASNVLASHISGDVPTFVKGMNQYLREIGCVGTHFCNPHGLFHPEHVTTAHDMTIIAREAMKNPLYRKIIKSASYKQKINGKVIRTLSQTNQLVCPDQKYYYPASIGGKTGFVKWAKYNIVSSAISGDRALLAAVHKAPSTQDRYRDIITIFDTAFSEKKESRFLFSKEDTSFLKELSGAKSPILAALAEDIEIKYYPSEESNYFGKVAWEDDLTLPISKGQVVAYLQVVDELGEILLEKPLFSAYHVRRTISASALYYGNLCLQRCSWVSLLSFMGIAAVSFALYRRWRAKRVIN